MKTSTITIHQHSHEGDHDTVDVTMLRPGEYVVIAPRTLTEPELLSTIVGGFENLGVDTIALTSEPR